MENSILFQKEFMGKKIYPDVDVYFLLFLRNLMFFWLKLIFILNFKISYFFQNIPKTMLLLKIKVSVDFYWYVHKV